MNSFRFFTRNVLVKTAVGAFKLSVFSACTAVMMGSCASPEPTNDSGLPIHETPQQESDLQQPADVEGQIVGRYVEKWEPVEIQIGHGISEIAFTDNNTGWAVSKDSIYRTGDGGNTWQTINAHTGLAGSGDKIEKFSIGDDGIVWVVIQHNDGTAFSKKDKTKVYQSLDGGKTWIRSLALNSSTFSDFRSSGRDAWIIGKTFISDKPQQFFPLIFRFSGTDNRWSNLSPGFKDFVDGQTGDRYNYPNLSKVGFASSSCVIVAAEERWLYETCNNGKVWVQMGDRSEDTHRPISISYLSVAAGTLELVEASGGVEGTGSLLLTLNLSDNKTIGSVSLPSFYVTKALWSSQERIIAAGKRAGNPTAADDEGDGDVILETSDGGKSWNEVFFRKSKSTGTFSFVGSQIAWLIDEEGKTYRISNMRN